MSKKRTILLFLLVITAGLALRLWSFDSIRPYSSDEGMFLRQARFMALVMKKGLGQEIDVIDTDAAGIWRYVRKSDWYYKPCWLHSGFMAVAMLFFGISTPVAAVTNLLFSMAAIVIVWLIARQLQNDMAWFSPLLLSVSAYWLIYSRSFMAEVDGVFFVLLSFLILIRELDRGRSRGVVMLLAGCSAALAALCHYKLLYVCLPVGLAVLLLSPVKKRIFNTLLVGLGYVLTLAIVEGALKLVIVVMKPDIPFTGLMGALMERYLSGSAGVEQHTGIQPGNLIAYMYYLGRTGGWVALALSLIGGVSVIRVDDRRQKRIVIAVLLFVFVTLAMLSCQVWIVARGISVLIPFACLLAGQGLQRLVQFLREQKANLQRVGRILVIMLVIGILAENLLKDIRYLGNDTGHEETASFLAGHARPARIFADPASICILEWYEPGLGCESYLDIVYGPVELADLDDAIIVFDAARQHYYPVNGFEIDKFEGEVASRGKMIFKIDNLTTMWQEFLLDGTQGHHLVEILDSIENADIEALATIRGYRVGTATP